MDSHPDREQALKDLVETNRALVKEVRAIREYVDILHEQQKRLKRNRILILILFVGAMLAMLAVPVALLVVGMIATSQTVPTQTEDPWQRYERQLDRADRQLDRNEKLVERTDALLKRWEKAAPKE